MALTNAIKKWQCSTGPEETFQRSLKMENNQGPILFKELLKKQHEKFNLIAFVRPIHGNFSKRRKLSSIWTDLCDNLAKTRALLVSWDKYALAVCYGQNQCENVFCHLASFFSKCLLLLINKMRDTHEPRKWTERKLLKVSSKSASRARIKQKTRPCLVIAPISRRRKHLNILFHGKKWLYF